MQALVRTAMIALLLIVAPVEAQTPDKWVKGAPFPEPSEELVGASADGEFYVFGGLGPGWIPQGLVYEYDLTVVKARMPTERSGGAWAVYKGRIYVAGGEHQDRHLMAAFRALEAGGLPCSRLMALRRSS